MIILALAKYIHTDNPAKIFYMAAIELLVLDAPIIGLLFRAIEIIMNP